MAANPLLTVETLAVRIPASRGLVSLVREVDFTLERGDILGIVGESGSGKSLTALAIMGLLPERAVASGRVRFEGEDLLAASEERLCRLRGDRIAMVFQEPMTALNPVQTVGAQIAESLVLHRGMAESAALAEAERLIDRVRLPEPRSRLAQYPHQLSGGQRQRVMIAIALACAPDILIADEPTTALDVTVQAQILDLIHDLVEDSGMALILISHDLGVIYDVTDRVLVMYAGRVVESGPTVELYERRGHPYTAALFGALPRAGVARGSRLVAIPGTVPEPSSLAKGCAFADRCRLAIEPCRAGEPPWHALGTDHRALCLRAGENAP
ncbi:MAG: ABC transporter ATP-binding protein [Proteobacteria bacterium]|nr:ABC transporter ATP-binding protein [Pseudomonadota bacterium]MBI3495833.1 ABC transporter ATP-binding protein [Pseudomonadota bacterium]